MTLSTHTDLTRAARKGSTLRMTTTTLVLVICLAITSDAFGSHFGKRQKRGHPPAGWGRNVFPCSKKLGSLQADVQGLNERLGGLDTDLGQVSDAVGVLEGLTEVQQMTLDALTGACDCASFAQRLTALEDAQPMVDPNDGNLRIVDANGDDADIGRVEIFFFGRWGTICQNNWSKADAIVACTQLGKPFGDPEALRDIGSTYGSADDLSIWLDNIICDGSEARLADCRRNSDGIGMTGCDHDKDAGLNCKD